jgi:pimeloyl-ACP methyl ester carboxylesterase
LADKDRYNELKNITVPTLIIHGTIDPLIPFQEGKRTSELIANNTFIEVQKMSHLIDKPVLDSIDKILINHLDGVILEQDMIL